MRKELGMFVALLLLCGIVDAANPDFHGANNLVNTSRQVAMLATFALGISFVIITGGIDLSVGSVIGLSGVIIARLSAPIVDGGISGMGLPLWVGISVAMMVSLLIGLLQGLLITRTGLQPFIVTLSGMLIIRGISQTITRGGNISFGDSPLRDLADQGFDVGVFLVTWPVVIFAMVFVLAGYLLHGTVFGRHLYAVGGNRDAAEYSGIPVRRVETLAYVISAGLAGLAGIPYAAYIGQMSHTVGASFELFAIAAAVLGGCSLRGGEGTVVGVLIGSAIMRVLENGINLFRVAYYDAEGTRHLWRLDENWKEWIIGAVILGAVLLDQFSHMWRQRAARKQSSGA